MQCGTQNESWHVVQSGRAITQAGMGNVGTLNAGGRTRRRLKPPQVVLWPRTGWVGGGMGDVGERVD